jgi:hypothetical protein
VVLMVFLEDSIKREKTKTGLSHLKLADSELCHFGLLGHMFSHVDIIIM